MIERIKAYFRKRREAWPKAAAAIGGTHHPQSRWYRNDEHIAATLSGVPVKLDSYTVSTGKSSATYTRVVAPFAYGPGVKMRVAKRGFLSAIGNAIGLDDHAVGEAAFDDAFVVRGNNAAVVRRLWTASARARMSGVLADTWVTADADKVTLTGNGRWIDAERMCEAMRLVGELAGVDIYGVLALQQLGDVAYAPWPRVALDTGVRVVIGAEQRGGDLVMVARADAPIADELKIYDGKPVDDRVLPQAAHVHASRAGTGTLANGAFTWRDLELDPARLRAGAELLGALASGGSLYR